VVQRKKRILVERREYAKSKVSVDGNKFPQSNPPNERSIREEIQRELERENWKRDGFELVVNKKRRRAALEETGKKNLTS